MATDEPLRLRTEIRRRQWFPSKPRSFSHKPPYTDELTARGSQLTFDYEVDDLGPRDQQSPQDHVPTDNKPSKTSTIAET